jgi:hypothetical protein
MAIGVWSVLILQLFRRVHASLIGYATWSPGYSEFRSRGLCNIEHSEILACVIVSSIAKMRFSNLLQEKRFPLQRGAFSCDLTPVRMRSQRNSLPGGYSIQ